MKIRTVIGIFLALLIIFIFSKCSNNVEVTEEKIETVLPLDKQDLTHEHSSSETLNQIAFNPKDISTWGKVVEVNSQGVPSVYKRKLPNGNTLTFSFHHGNIADGYQVASAGENADGGIYEHWYQEEYQAPIFILDGTLGPWSKELKKAAAIWSQSIKINISVIRSPKKLLTGEACWDSEISGKVIACNFDFDVFFKGEHAENANGFGITKTNPDGHIRSGIIGFNNNGPLTDPAEETPERIELWKAHLGCHEMGHVIGLGHNDSNLETFKNTCMDYSKVPVVLPDDHDWEELKKTHGHTHGIIDGVICKRKGARGTIFETHHREISFNGEKAIVGRVRPYREEDKAIRNPQRLVFQMNKENVSYQWNVIDADSDHTDNYSNNTDMKAKNHPSIGSPKVHVSNAARSVEAQALDAEAHFKSLIRMGESGSVSDFSCRKASGHELFDIKEFTPPLPEEDSGGYNLVPVKDANGNEQRNERGTLFEYVPVLYRHSKYTRPELSEPVIK